jgi:hypothetical protein
MQPDPEHDSPDEEQESGQESDISPELNNLPQGRQLKETMATSVWLLTLPLPCARCQFFLFFFPLCHCLVDPPCPHIMMDAARWYRTVSNAASDMRRHEPYGGKKRMWEGTEEASSGPEMQRLLTEVLHQIGAEYVRSTVMDLEISSGSSQGPRGRRGR